MSHWYFPLLDKDGVAVPRDIVGEGGPCGTPVTADKYAP